MAQPHSFHPEGRSHHPTIPGFWLHDTLGWHEIAPGEHHSTFFIQHPELFGTDLQKAYNNGWVSIRRWTAEPTMWLIVYGQYANVEPLLREWARYVINQWPEEAVVDIRLIPLYEQPRNICRTLQELE